MAVTVWPSFYSAKIAEHSSVAKESPRGIFPARLVVARVADGQLESGCHMYCRVGENEHSPYA